MKSRHFFVLSALTLAASLTACGGGGSGSNTTPVSVGVGTAPVTAPVTVAPINTAIVTTVVAANYATGSEEQAAFNRLNAERGQCGFGLLTQAVQLDAAAKSHNDYQIINNLRSHFENLTQFPKGFTGAEGIDRAIAKGYIDSGSVSDEFTVKINLTNKSGSGDMGIRDLLSAPYHLAGLMDGNRDVGLSVRSSIETTPVGVNPSVFFHVNSSYKSVAGKQLITAGNVQTYPCQGSTGVSRQLTNETPNPIPGRDLSTNPIGTPIYIATRDGTQLTIATTSLKETISNTAIVLRIPITAENDPQAFYKANQGYVAPDAPLKALTQYTATVTGTANGAAFSKTFNFTTGA